MNFLERYRNGEHEQVWNELQSLGPSVRQEPYASQAQAVATETMRRVRRNSERLISHLQALGYIFGTFPDGTRRSYTADPLIAPSEQLRADCDELESEAGPLPLSLI